MKSASLRPALRLAASAAVPRQADTTPRQMSRANGFEGRGRDAGRARNRPMPLRPVERDAVREAWAWAMEYEFSTRERCAADIGVTFQTACNWFDGFSTATGDKVVQFSIGYPDTYAAMQARVSA